MGKEICIKSLSKKFNSRVIIDNINFMLKPGELLLLTGSNGAGKTTLLNIIFGMLKATNGQIILNDADISGFPTYKRFDLGIRYLTQDYYLIEDCKVNEIIDILIHNSMANKNELLNKLNNYTYIFDYNKFKDSIINKLSRGERRKLELIICLINNGSIYLFDEPISSLDNQSKILALNEFGKIKAQLNSAIICEHEITDGLLKICDRVLYLNESNLTEYSPDEFKKYQSQEKIVF